MSKGLAGILTTVLMPLNETGHNVGEHKHRYQRGQQTQNVKLGLIKSSGRPQSFV